MAEAAVDEDAARTRAVDQCVEQVTDGHVLATQLQIHVLGVAGGIVEHDSHQRRSQGIAVTRAQRGRH